MKVNIRVIDNEEIIRFGCHKFLTGEGYTKNHVDWRTRNAFSRIAGKGYAPSMSGG